MQSAIEKIEEFYEKTDFNSIIAQYSRDAYIRFFLIKSICKWPSFKEFNKYISTYWIDTTKKVTDWFLFYYWNANITNELLIKFVEAEYLKQSGFIKIEEIITQLCKLPFFDWGWIYQNALEWKIVRYIQKSYDFEYVKWLLEWDLFTSFQNYWLSSWYNYWSSVIVEHYFKSHRNVIPTVWLIKHIDFIFDWIPVDLQVTYLPQEYVDIKRKEEWLEREFKVLKDKMKSIDGIDFDNENLWNLSHALNTAKNLWLVVFDEIKKFRNGSTEKLLTNTIESDNLITWLYENQWTRRYDNSFRIFLVCIDDIDITWAWQMKINRWLETKINQFLEKWAKLREIKYNWEWRDKSTLASILLVTKSSY